MIWLQKTAIVLLLLIGLPVTLLATLELVDPNNPASEKDEAAAALVILGFPPSLLGGALMLNVRRQHQQKLKQAEHEQEKLFLELLQESGGKLTTVQFATRANLSLEDAKEYLDEKALQLNGYFDTTDAGAIVYRFPM